MKKVPLLCHQSQHDNDLHPKHCCRRLGSEALLMRSFGHVRWESQTHATR